MTNPQNPQFEGIPDPEETKRRVMNRLWQKPELLDKLIEAMEEADDDEENE